MMSVYFLPLPFDLLEFSSQRTRFDLEAEEFRSKRCIQLCAGLQPAPRFSHLNF